MPLAVASRKREKKVRSPKPYFFHIIIEPDKGGFFAYCPELEDIGGAISGKTEKEAMENITLLLNDIVKELQEDGLPIPQNVKTFDKPIVTVTL